ncbi:unnamed protein product [Closterium sp. NIES-53]
MNQSGLPKKYWPYAMNHTVRLHNLLSTMANRGNLSPYMKWTGSRGDTSMLRVWGYKYQGWLILDIDTNKIVPACETFFYERLTLQQWTENQRRNVARAYAKNGRSFASPKDEATAAALDRDPADEHPGAPPCPRVDDDDDDNDTPAPGPSRHHTQLSTSSPAHESDDDDVVEVTTSDTIGAPNVTGLQLLGLHTSVTTLTRAVEPKNPRQALTGPHAKEWRAAMDAELKELESRDTWVLVDLAAVKGRRVLSSCFKAHWVVRRYDQCHGIDFDQTFTPVSHHTSVRILLAIAAAKELPLRRIDIKNAFLYALVDATIFVEQPHTYGEGDPRVFQLKKSLYEIKQAPCLWQQHLQKILLEISFKQLPHDPGMYPPPLQRRLHPLERLHRRPAVHQHP